MPVEKSSYLVLFTVGGRGGLLGLSFCMMEKFQEIDKDHALSLSDKRLNEMGTSGVLFHI